MRLLCCHSNGLVHERMSSGDTCDLVASSDLTAQSAEDFPLAGALYNLDLW